MDTASLPQNSTSEDIEIRRQKWKILDICTKETQVNSDIYFLKECKKNNTIPNGLLIKNPMKTTYNTKYSNDLCHCTSLKLRNHLIHLLYNKQKIFLERKRQAIHLLQAGAYNEDLRDKINTHIERNQAKTLENKKRKLQKILPPEIHTKQQKEVNQNQVINLSNHQLTQAETTVLTKGLNFCPSSKFDKIQICGDTERYIRRLRLKEYYRENTIDGSNDPNLDNNTTFIRERKTSIWTPRPGRNSTLEKYIDALRHCVNSQI